MLRFHVVEQTGVLSDLKLCAYQAWLTLVAAGEATQGCRAYSLYKSRSESSSA